MRQVADLVRTHVAEQPVPAKVEHLLDVFAPDAPDDEWMEYCKKRSFLPITRDLSRTNNGPKLSRVCQSLDHPHVRFTARVGELAAAEQASAIISVYRQLHEAWRAPKSTCYQIGFTNDRLRFVLTHR